MRSTFAYNPSGTVPSVGSAPICGAAPLGDNPATTLRNEAYAECGKTHWRRCLQLLDLAKTSNVEGDNNPQVQSTRALVTQMLGKDGG